jgi:hypothetical protein
MDVVSANSNPQWVGSTVFIQRKPEENYGNLTILSYGKGSTYNVVEEDFNVQARFEANVVPTITSRLGENTTDVTISNSNISVNSYRADGTLIT